jgi:hypothetical protein
MCTVKPAMTTTMVPVCGCDGVTYFNDTVAANRFSENVRSASGECTSAQSVKCNGTSQKCDGQRVCSLGLSSENQCMVALINPGACWGLPPTCPAPLDGKFTECSNGGSSMDCRSRCDAIQNEKLYFLDSNCP